MDFRFRLLSALMKVNLILTLAGLGLLIFFSYQGFKAGEMGVMVGIFSILGVLFNSGIAVLLFFIIKGLRNRSKNAVVGALVFTLFTLVASFPTISIGLLPFLVILAYLIFTLIMEITCLKKVPGISAG